MIDDGPVEQIRRALLATRAEVRAEAARRVGWIERNFLRALEASQLEGEYALALAGVEADAEARRALTNAAAVALVVGYSLGDLDHPPEVFDQLLIDRPPGPRFLAALPLADIVRLPD